MGGERDTERQRERMKETEREAGGERQRETERDSEVENMYVFVPTRNPVKETERQHHQTKMLK